MVGFVQSELGQVEPVETRHSGQNGDQDSRSEGVQPISFLFGTCEDSERVHPPGLYSILGISPTAVGARLYSSLGGIERYAVAFVRFLSAIGRCAIIVSHVKDP